MPSPLDMPRSTLLYNPMRLHRNLHERQPSLDRKERMLVCGFLRRYVQWCARSGRHDRILGAMELDAWVNRQPLRPTEFPRIDRRGPDAVMCPTMWDMAGRRRR